MKTAFYSLVTFTFLFITAYSFGQARIFIKATDRNNTPIEGGSEEPGHEKEIEVLAFVESDVTCALETTGGGPRACRAVTGPWNFTMTANRSIIPLKTNMYYGYPLKNVDISFEKSTPTGFVLYYKVHMEEAFVTTISESGAGEIPTFYIILDPVKISWTYLVQGPAGTPLEIPFGWDREKNAPF